MPRRELYVICKGSQKYVPVKYRNKLLAHRIFPIPSLEYNSNQVMKMSEEKNVKPKQSLCRVDMTKIACSDMLPVVLALLVQI